MKTWKLNTYLMIGLQGVILLGGLLAAANMSADDTSRKQQASTKGPLIHSLEGRGLFKAYCASCHGTDAKGNGPVSPILITNAPDLTTIAKRNGGVFPGQRVRKIIAGDEITISHGTREMPVWGPIFHQVEEDHDYGEVRLQNLTDYLRSLQGK